MLRLIIFAFLMLPQLASGAEAAGRVFLDTNKNGLLDGSESGVAGEFGRVHHGHAVIEITAGFAGSEKGMHYPSK